MTAWFNRRPGQSICVEPEGEDPSQPVMMVIGAESPDWIRVPLDTPHADAGKELEVGDIGDAPCPLCLNQDKRRIEVRTYAFTHSELLVSECGKHGFVWFELPKK